MKNSRLIRLSAIVVLLSVILSMIPVSVSAKDPTKISATEVTSIVLAEAYDSITPVGETIYLETTLGPAYFDRVRNGDRLALKVSVEKAGTYQWCLLTGWAENAVNGTFTLFIDGKEAGKIVNEVGGAGWRTWLDTTPGTVELPAGEHELEILFSCDGPNIYALKFAPEGVDMTVEAGYASFCEKESNHAVQIVSTYAIQFHMTVPFDAVTVGCPSYNNNKGSLRFELFQWKESYEKTVDGTPIATQEFVNFQDNANLTMKFDQPVSLGEYVLLLTNTSAPGEQVGVWTSTTPTNQLRSFLAGVEIENSTRGNVHFIGSTQAPFGAISANLHETPSFPEITESQKDLAAYHLPASSRYHAATVSPDTWVFTDGLGRQSVTFAEVGGPREGKNVAMFFWNWHATFGNIRTHFNVQQYIDQMTEKGIPLEDYLYDYDHAGWLAKDHSVQYFWDEPIYGYYRSDDTWVMRKQAELLTAAGVDVIFTDNSNATLTWGDSYPLLYQTWLKAMQDGVETPKISNHMPFGAGNDTRIQLLEMYTNIYHDGNYRPLWFYWEGKPMILAHGVASLRETILDQQIKDFFTFRTPMASYFTKSGDFGTWGWLSTYPQARYYASRDDRADKNVEQISVGVAQNANYVNQELAAMSGHHIMGRSYTRNYQDRYEKEGDEASKWGYNFAEQWEFAIKTDPSMVFVTGWNEWCASRYASWPDGGKSVVENAFPDQFNNEFSRDVEPSRGDLQDHYYYQLVNYIRRYKGVNPIPTPSAPAAIDIQAGEEQWQTIEPYYAAYIGNTGDRNAKGYGALVYTEYSGRNDIIGAQVSRDAENLWFHVECAADITPYTDKLWMNLYIDVETTEETAGWNSFDFVLNKTAPTDKTAVLEKFTDGYQSEKVADVEYAVNGRYMTVKIPKSALGIFGDLYTVNFAWTDNVHDVADTGTPTEQGDVVYSTFSGDILDFYTSGDVAPGGRFKFSYVVNDENADSEEDTTAPDTSVPTPDTQKDPTPEPPAVTDPETDVIEKEGCKSTLPTFSVLGALVCTAVALRKKKND